jgi:valyl-tRNA synthetase
VETKPTSYTGAGDLCDILTSQQDVFAFLARVEPKVVAVTLEEVPAGSGVVTGQLTTTLVVEVDVDKERERFELEIANLEGEIARAEQLLANVGFATKAPPEVVCRERDKLARYQRELKELAEKLEGLGE